jgi:hypothetical protein
MGGMVFGVLECKARGSVSWNSDFEGIVKVLDFVLEVVGSH